MVSKFALLSKVLLATMALAAPSSLVEDPLAHRSEDRQPINSVASRAGANVPSMLLGYPPNWAGAFWRPTQVRVILMVHDYVQAQFCG